MKRFLIVLILGLLAMIVAPTQSMAYEADQQHETALVINQSGNTVDVLQATPVAETDFALVDVPQHQKVCMAGMFAFAQDESLSDGQPTDPVPNEVQNEPDNQESESTTPLKFLGSYWAELFLALLALIKIIVRLTPSIKDDKVFGRLDDFVSAIFPNNEKRKV